MLKFIAELLKFVAQLLKCFQIYAHTGKQEPSTHNIDTLDRIERGADCCGFVVGKDLGALGKTWIVEENLIRSWIASKY